MDDARRITDELVQLIDIEHKDVAIVAHSYEGIVASQLSRHGLTRLLVKLMAKARVLCSNYLPHSLPCAYWVQFVITSRRTYPILCSR